MLLNKETRTGRIYLMKLPLKIPGLPSSEAELLRRTSRPEWHAMIIQLWHSRSTDFVTELYGPVQNASFFQDHVWIFPHEGDHISSRESLKTVDCFIAEVSTPATGLGIELWFASAYGKRILCIYKQWSQTSSSLKFVTDEYIEYENAEDMIAKIWNFLKNQ